MEERVLNTSERNKFASPSLSCWSSGELLLFHASSSSSSIKTTLVKSISATRNIPYQRRISIWTENIVTANLQETPIALTTTVKRVRADSQLQSSKRSPHPFRHGDKQVVFLLIAGTASANTEVNSVSCRRTSTRRAADAKNCWA